MTKSVKIEEGGEQLLVTFGNIMDMKWTSYALRFELEAEDAANSVVHRNSSLQLHEKERSFPFLPAQQY